MCLADVKWNYGKINLPSNFDYNEQIVSEMGLWQNGRYFQTVFINSSFFNENYSINLPLNFVFSVE